MKKTVKQLPSGVWAVIDGKGVIEIYTNQEYKHINWWNKVTQKYFNL